MKKNRCFNILYVGWDGHGNLGDDLLFDVFRQQIAHIQLRIMIPIVVYSNSEYYEIDIKDYDLVVLGAGSLFSHSRFLEVCKKALRNYVPYIIWGTGIDIRSDAVSKMIVENYYKKRSIPKVVKNLPNYDSIQELVENARLASCRGRITNYIVSHHKLKIIGDPGMLYECLVKDDGKANGHVNVQDKMKTIAINWGTVFNSLRGNCEDALRREMIMLIKALVLLNYKVIVYPMWEKDIIYCKDLVETIDNKRVILIDKQLDTKGIINLLSQCKMSINLKLHANVLSMISEIPFVCMGYGLKCKDFMDSIGCAQYEITTKEFNCYCALEMIHKIDQDYDYLIGHYKKTKKYYMRLNRQQNEKMICLINSLVMTNH